MAHADRVDTPERIAPETQQVSRERVVHPLVNSDGSFLSPYHLGKHFTARHRVCAGNARTEIGRPPEKTALLRSPTR